jgi:hypothetical protein
MPSTPHAQRPACVLLARACCARPGPLTCVFRFVPGNFDALFAYLTCGNYDFNYDVQKGLRPRRSVRTAMAHEIMFHAIVQKEGLVHLAHTLFCVLNHCSAC